jgi:hypothetical protein
VCVCVCVCVSERHEGVSKSFRTGRLERELQTVQLSATRCSCIAILCVSLVSFAVITLCVASQRVLIVVYFVIDSSLEILDIPSYLQYLEYCIMLKVLIGAGIGQWYSVGLRAGWSVFRVPAGSGNFSLHRRVQTGSGAHPASYSVGTTSYFPGVKRPGRKAENSLPSSAEVKNVWSYVFTLPIRLHGVVLSLKKAQGQLYLYLTYITQVCLK